MFCSSPLQGKGTLKPKEEARWGSWIEKENPPKRVFSLCGYIVTRSWTPSWWHQLLLPPALHHKLMGIPAEKEVPWGRRSEQGRPPNPATKIVSNPQAGKWSRLVPDGSNTPLTPEPASRSRACRKDMFSVLLKVSFLSPVSVELSL